MVLELSSRGILIHFWIVFFENILWKDIDDASLSSQYKLKQPLSLVRCIKDSDVESESQERNIELEEWMQKKELEEAPCGLFSDEAWDGYLYVL